MEIKKELTETQIRIVKTIIEWAKMAQISKHTEYPDNGTTFSIPHKEFKIIPSVYMNNFMKDFFDRLKEQKCLTSWANNPYAPADLASFVFSQVNIKRLENILDSNRHPALLRNDVREKIQKIKSMDILGKKEMRFLTELSNLKPQTTKTLSEHMQSKNIYKIKAVVNTKIKKHDLKIDTLRRKGTPSFYQLVLAPSSK